MMRDDSPLVTAVGEEIVFQGENKRDSIEKWSTFVNGKDGFLYGIPCEARRVVKFNPVDKSLEMIGPDLGKVDTWSCGVLANNGCIYCPPDNLFQYQFGSGGGMKMLKINTHDGTMVTFDTNKGEWSSGALGADNCIYYMPSSSNDFHILRVDPHTDTLSYIRVPSCNFVGTVLGKDNCIYGLSWKDSVMRFDPTEPENVSYIRNDEDFDFDHEFCSDGVLGNDGHIYALNKWTNVLKIDTSARTISSIRNSSLNDEDFTQPIIGLDQCIYWPPRHAETRVLKFDPATQQPVSLVGSSSEVCWFYESSSLSSSDSDSSSPSHYGLSANVESAGWNCGALASDGVIYCAPFRANYVIAIDPLRELSMTMKQRMKHHPDELGRLFVPNNKSYSESLFGSAVRKFGLARALRLLDECLPSDDEWAERHRNVDSVSLVKRKASGGRKRKRSYGYVPLFALAASGGKNVGDVPLSVIYHLVRRNLHGLLIS